MNRILTTDDEPPLAEAAWTDTVLRGPIGQLGGRHVEINGSTNATVAAANRVIIIQDWAIKLY